MSIRTDGNNSSNHTLNNGANCRYNTPSSTTLYYYLLYEYLSRASKSAYSILIIYHHHHYYYYYLVFDFYSLSIDNQLMPRISDVYMYEYIMPFLFESFCTQNCTNCRNLINFLTRSIDIFSLSLSYHFSIFIILIMARYRHFLLIRIYSRHRMAKSKTQEIVPRQVNEVARSKFFFAEQRKKHYSCDQL